MRTIRKTFIALCLFGLCVFAQGQSSGNIQQPTFQWRCETGDTMLNFNPATIATLHFDSIPYAENYTLIVVYKPVADTESTVWNLLYGDSVTRSLTTERILSGNTAIRYADSTGSRPAIHTLRQSAPESDTSYIQMTLGDGNLMMAIRREGHSFNNPHPGVFHKQQYHRDSRASYTYKGNRVW